jgi:hypothetical protein
MTFTDPEVRVRSIPTASALVLAGNEPVRIQSDGVIVFAPSAMEAFEKFCRAKQWLDHAVENARNGSR